MNGRGIVEMLMFVTFFNGNCTASKIETVLIRPSYIKFLIIKHVNFLVSQKNVSVH